ncbi:MAG: hypothetical protein Q9208_004673 [Pyrenodesmia sp. 3 TL-2023]
MLPLSLLLLFALLCNASATAYDATCDDIYGRPSTLACIRILTTFQRSKRDKFFGVYPACQGPKPWSVSDAAWAARNSLPWVHSDAGCNMALLSVYKPDGRYTAAVASPFDIVSLEGPKGVLGDCVIVRGLGGFRQTLLNQGLVLVLYADGSAYENYLLSGYGASHYDAAKLLPGDKLNPVWFGARADPDGFAALGGRGSLTQPYTGVFSSQNASQRLTSS